MQRLIPYLLCCCLTAMLCSCASSHQEAFNWDNINYARYACNGNSEAPGCKAEDDSISSVSRSKK